MLGQFYTGQGRQQAGDLRRAREFYVRAVEKGEGQSAAWLAYQVWDVTRAEIAQSRDFAAQLPESVAALSRPERFNLALAYAKRSRELGTPHGTFILGMWYYNEDKHINAGPGLKDIGRQYIQQAASGGFSPARTVCDQQKWAYRN
jgi:TPR repeat protein